MKEFLKLAGLYIGVIAFWSIIAVMIHNLADDDNIVGYVFSFIERHITLAIIVAVCVTVYVAEHIKNKKKEGD